MAGVEEPAPLFMWRHPDSAGRDDDDRQLLNFSFFSSFPSPRFLNLQSSFCSPMSLESVDVSDVPYTMMLLGDMSAGLEGLLVILS